MTALIIIPWANGPVFPDNFQCNWQLQRQLLDNDGNPVKALMAVDITEDVANQVQAKQWPSLEWVGAVDPVEGRYLNIAEAAAAKVQNEFMAKVEALTKDGFLDPVTGIRIKATPDKIAGNWTPQCLLLFMAKIMDGLPGDTPIQTYDFNDQLVTMTLDQYLRLMIRMGQDYFAKFQQAAQ